MKITDDILNLLKNVNTLFTGRAFLVQVRKKTYVKHIIFFGV
jgi:hypothetical protein